MQIEWAHAYNTRKGDPYSCKQIPPYYSIDCGITQDNDENLCSYAKRHIPELEQFGLNDIGGNCTEKMDWHLKVQYCNFVYANKTTPQDVINQKVCLSFYVGAYNLERCVWKVQHTHKYDVASQNYYGRLAMCYNGSVSYGEKVQSLLLHPVRLLASILKTIATAF